MKVLLVYPPVSLEAGRNFLVPSQGLISLDDFIRAKGVDVEIYYKRCYDVSDLLRKIRECRPNVLGISCDSGNANNCFKLAELVKKIDNNVCVVLGGAHATYFHKMILEKIFWVDVVVRGEGEVTLSEIVDCFRERGMFSDLKRVQGITYRIKDKIVVNEERPFIQDLNSLPFLTQYNRDNHRLKMNEYYPGSFMVETGRGCNYACRFCGDVGLFRKMYREKSPEKIVQEILMYKEHYNVRRILFWESTFTRNKQRVEDICQCLKKNKVKVDWWCQTRVDCVDKALLKVMKMAGCSLIVYGVESLSDVVLRSMGKGHKTSLAKEVLTYTNQLGIETGYNIILGYPGENKSTLGETFLNLRKLDKKIFCEVLGMFELYPGSIIYEQLKNKGFINDEMWFKDFKIGDFIKRYYHEDFQKTLLHYKNLIQENFVKDHKFG